MLVESVVGFYNFPEPFPVHMVTPVGVCRDPFFLDSSHADQVLSDPACLSCSDSTGLSCSV